MANANGILATLERKASVSTAQPDRFTHIARTAQTLSRRTVDMAVVELLSEAHSRLIVLCYEKDECNIHATSMQHFCNIDPATGRILIPLPWGKKGYAKWGLSPSEADVFRRIMFARQRSGLPLFFFDRSRRAWFVNLREYPVLPVLAEWNISVGEYRAARSG